MRETLLVIVFVFAGIWCASSQATAEDDMREWRMFREMHPRVYGTAEEETRRFGIFCDNLRAAEALRRDAPGAEWGWTAFSDLTPAEFSARHGLLRQRLSSSSSSLPLFQQSATTTVGQTDWVARGLVSSIKDQRQCGSCWAFAAAGGAEGCAAARLNKTVDLSPQQLMDCTLDGLGCNGGLPNMALHWATKHDMATWGSYPYQEKKSSCRHESQWVVGLKAHTCEYHKVAMHESAIREALTHATVPIAVAAAPLQSYRSGVINGSACNHKLVDHAVLLVADTKDVYTIKNSWGPYWGEKGFFRMVQNKNCLLMTTDASVAY